MANTVRNKGGNNSYGLGALAVSGSSRLLSNSRMIYPIVVIHTSEVLIMAKFNVTVILKSQVPVSTRDYLASSLATASEAAIEIDDRLPAEF